MPGDGHAGFGGRTGETHREQPRQGAPVRPNNLAEAVRQKVAAHSTCRAKAAPPPIREGARAITTRERWAQVHNLLDKGVGLLECSRRLGLTLNTVTRYARISEPERLIRAPQYRPTLVDP
ncbi:hypothetical protein ThrDRAFT_04806 [Frankia casuarinae]|nr:hypothetical protein CcI6DRAFT_04890 [Frankia sp. CcI6]EYT89574.1 hypothetical protein ThrDRAFT_04806 [Frankia casuarinae]KFB01041.1 hypothetical protein ALLO2DRAFT_04830 [Frankia sp. Allo2]OAA18066.1 hypothetical protein AAY23_11565 [Frankia casuarinae]